MKTSSIYKPGFSFLGDLKDKKLGNGLVKMNPYSLLFSVVFLEWRSHLYLNYKMGASFRLQLRCIPHDAFSTVVAFSIDSDVSIFLSPTTVPCG